MNPELELLFSKKHLRLTSPRQRVFQALQESHEPLLIADIIKNCPSVDRVSVYRTIELFTKLHIVEIVPMGWKQRYELIDPFKAHHHHLYCIHCGALTDIHSHKLEHLVAAIANDYDFTPKAHKFEVSGICQNCSKATS